MKVILVKPGQNDDRSDASEPGTPEGDGIASVAVPPETKDINDGVAAVMVSVANEAEQNPYQLENDDRPTDPGTGKDGQAKLLAAEQTRLQNAETIRGLATRILSTLTRNDTKEIPFGADHVIKVGVTTNSNLRRGEPGGDSIQAAARNVVITLERKKGLVQAIRKRLVRSAIYPLYIRIARDSNGQPDCSVSVHRDADPIILLEGRQPASVRCFENVTTWGTAENDKPLRNSGEAEIVLPGSNELWTAAQKQVAFEEVCKILEELLGN